MTKPSSEKNNRKPKSKKAPKKLGGKKLHLRNLRVEDYEQVIALQLICFPGMQTWDADQIKSQIDIFPEGQICIEYDGRLIASSSSLIVDFDLHSNWHNWQEIADNGYIRNHDSEGDTMYGIEIMVHPDFRGYRLSRRIYDARKELVRKTNLARILVGGRIPGYGKHADDMTAQDYVERVVSKELYDPVLTAQFSNGFELRGLIPGYFPSDSASRGYATFLEWTNYEFRSDPVRSVRISQSVRVGLVQYEMRTIDTFEEFATHCRYFVDSAADYRSDFLLFPELFTTQLLSTVPPLRPGLAARQLSEFTDRYIELFTSLAIKYNINIIAGSQFSVIDNDLYNVAYLFRRDGSYDTQRKIHITPSEKKWWGVRGGDKMKVLQTDRGRIAICICYDIEFPELCRIAVSKGARIIFVPYNTSERNGYLRVRYCAQARCVENHVYVVMAGCTGNLPDVENADIHYAQSGIFSPLDLMFAREGIVAECTPNIETVLVHDIDVEFLRQHRYMGATLNWQDRRTDIYHIHFKSEDEDVEI